MIREGSNVVRIDALEVRARLVKRGFYELAVEIAARHHIGAMTLLGRGRTASVARARRELYAMLRQKALSLPEIGALLGRDHTSVMAGLQRYKSELPAEPTERVRVAV